MAQKGLSALLLFGGNLLGEFLLLGHEARELPIEGILLPLKGSLLLSLTGQVGFEGLLGVCQFV